MNNQELAKQDYMAGMKYKDIATKYDVSINTVKSWKKRNDWVRGAPENKSMHTKGKKRAHKAQKVAPEVVQELVDNDELTDKRKMFCLYYLQRFNATWAYTKAYGADYETARRNGSRLLSNADVQKQIKELKKSLANDLNVTLTDIAKQYASQAFSDIGDYIEFGTEEVVVRDGWFKPVKDKITGKLLTEEQSYVHLKDKAEVDTSLIKQVHIGRDGVVVELEDKQKALSALTKLLDENDQTNGVSVKIVRSDRRKTDDGNNS